MKIEQLSSVQAILGESPFWSPAEDAVWWVDITAGRILRTSIRAGKTLGWETGEQTGFVVPEAGGRIVTGLVSGLFLFDPNVGSFSKLAPNPIKGSRFNDAVTDPVGRLIAGVMDLDNATPLGAIYSIGPDLNFRMMFDGLYTPNGLAFDPVRGRMYFSDSHPESQTIWVCDYDIETGETSARRIFVSCQDFDGRPDGGFCDVDGNYWIAGVGGGSCLWKFTPEGVQETVPVPMPDPTKPIFDKSGNLFLTSKKGENGGGYLATATGGPAGVEPVAFVLAE
jgi:sugar lactone lactonase YvrE